MSASAALVNGATEDASLACPPLLQRVMDRAAMQYIARGNPAVVEFQFEVNGSEQPFLARPDWSDGECAPRLIVYAARTGEFVCRSLLQDWFVPDPAPNSWSMDFDLGDAGLLDAKDGI